MEENIPQRPENRAEDRARTPLIQPHAGKARELVPGLAGDLCFRCTKHQSAPTVGTHWNGIEAYTVEYDNPRETQLAILHGQEQRGPEEGFSS